MDTSSKGIQIANNHMKKMPSTIHQWGIRMKITMSYHYSSIGMTKMKRASHPSVHKDMEQRECSCSADGNIK
jgi:hypothetical protein